MRPARLPARPAAAFAVLAAALAGCRQIAELPAGPPATPSAAAATAAPPERTPVWLASESAVFEQAQKVFEEAGCPEVRTAVVKVSEEAPLPQYRAADRTLYVPPFRDGPEKMRERLARLSALRFGGGLAFIERFASGELAYRAYSTFLTVAVAHELWHHVQVVRRPGNPPAPAEIYDLEAEAMEVEQAFLAHLIASGQAPEQWRLHYRQAVFSIKDSIPEQALASLPDEPKALRETFLRAYATYSAGEAAASGGVNVETAAAATVYAGYTQRRIALLASGPRPFKELVARPGR